MERALDKSFNNEALDQINLLARDRIGISTLERYTGSEASEFQPYVLLTNFRSYVDFFSEFANVPLRHGTVMRATHCPTRKISVIDYTLGSPAAALVVELISFTKPIAVIMLGMCGGLRKNFEVGDFFNPLAAIREEGTSNAFMPPQVPALSCFNLQRYVVDELERRDLTYHNGIIHTTNVRFWEFNEDFKRMLKAERAHAVDMECATLFSVGFARNVPVGALMLVSDLPLKADGIKTASSAKSVFKKYTSLHIDMGIEIMLKMQRSKDKGHCYQF